MIEKENLDCHFLLNVHDELLFETHEDQLDKCKKIIEDAWLDSIPKIR